MSTGLFLPFILCPHCQDDHAYAEPEHCDLSRRPSPSPTSSAGALSISRDVHLVAPRSRGGSHLPFPLRSVCRQYQDLERHVRAERPGGKAQSPRWNMIRDRPSWRGEEHRDGSGWLADDLDAGSQTTLKRDFRGRVASGRSIVPASERSMGVLPSGSRRALGRDLLLLLLHVDASYLTPVVDRRRSLICGLSRHRVRRTVALTLHVS